MTKPVHEEQLDILGEDSYTEKLLAHLDEVPTEEIRSNWPQDAAALLDIFSARLKKNGISPADAVKQAIKLLADAAEYGGGRTWYLPTKARLLQQLRDQNIYKDSRGMQVRDLVNKYKLSEPHIYRIIDQQRRMSIAGRQINLL
jgi:Mor family transcriptional regulator